MPRKRGVAGGRVAAAEWLIAAGPASCPRAAAETAAGQPPGGGATCASSLYRANASI